jgi:regulator of RNase E activity RraA
MDKENKFSELASTAYAEVLDRSQFMDFGIKALWHKTPRLAGSAFTVQLASGDNLMLHAAIHEAPAGSVIVVDAGDSEFAVAGGNVCAVAKKRGILGFVIDGVIRDFDEIRELEFPVFVRGVVPVPGKKEVVTPLNKPIKCGGATVTAGDIVIADADGVVVLPLDKADRYYEIAKARVKKDESISISAWEIEHREKIMKAIQS